jgi:hypothetical protein
MLAAADHVFLLIEEGTQGSTHHLGFRFVAPTCNLFQTVVHCIGNLHR